MAMSHTESLISRIPAALRMRVRLIVLGIVPASIPKHARISELTARRVARGESSRPNDPRRALSVRIMDEGIDGALEERCVEAAALLRKSGHETAEIQAMLMSAVRPILEYARDLGKPRVFPLPSAPVPDDGVEESVGDPSSLGGYLAGVDGGKIPSKAGA